MEARLRGLILDYFRAADCPSITSRPTPRTASGCLGRSGCWCLVVRGPCENQVRGRTFMTHVYYSQRTGCNPNPDGLSLSDTLDLFKRSYLQLEREGYFTEALGYDCIDAAERIEGEIKDIDLEILLAVRKKELWPIETHAAEYSEDDLFDMIEFLCQIVSKPIGGKMHSWGNCGMHWE